MPLWREAHFQVKMYKALQPRNTFGSWDVEKVYVVVVARSTFRSQNVQSTSALEHFWKLRCSKSVCRCGGSTCQSQNVQSTTCLRHFWTLKRGFVWQAQGILHPAASEQNVRVSKNHGRRGTLEEDLQRWISHGRRSTRDMFIRDVRRSGRWFPERGCILEHQIFRFAKMILRDRCSTLYNLEWKNRKTHWYEAVSSAFNFPFLKDVSQNSFVFDFVKFKNWGSQNCCVLDVVKFKNWGSLAELLRFWCCQVQKLRKSRRIASFLMLSSSKIEDVSQNCCVFKLTVRQTDRQADRQADKQADKQIQAFYYSYSYNYNYTTLRYNNYITLH